MHNIKPVGLNRPTPPPNPPQIKGFVLSIFNVFKKKKEDKILLTGQYNADEIKRLTELCRENYITYVNKYKPNTIKRLDMCWAFARSDAIATLNKERFIKNHRIFKGGWIEK